MKWLQNLYEVRKNIRFELKPYNITRQLLKGDGNYERLDSQIKHIKKWEFEENFNWNEFCKSQYSGFIKKSIKYYGFLSEINQEIWKYKDDTTKKEIFFDIRKSKWIFKNIPSLKRLEWFLDIKDKFLELEDEYKILFNFFDKLEDQSESAQKQSDVSKNLRKIAYINRNLFTIFRFFDIYKTDSDIIAKYNDLKKDVHFEKQNNSVIASHQNEVSGACIWKFTFNKYALFRRETKKLKEKYEKYKTLNKKSVSELILNKEIVDDKWNSVDLKFENITNLNLQKENVGIQEKLKKFDFNRELDSVISELDNINGEILNQYTKEFQENYKNNSQSISIQFETYTDRKTWKEKSNYKKDATLISLYWEEYNRKVKILRWKSLSWQNLGWQSLSWYEHLSLLWAENLKWIKKENQKLANKFVNIICKLDYINPDYARIKKIRDKLAKYRGKVRQDLKSSEREFINEAMIKYYANILEKDGNYFLALTEKEKIQWKDLKNIKIENNIQENIDWDTFIIYNYSSLSFHSLEKLCLLWDGSLIQNDELQKLWNQYKYQKKDIKVSCQNHHNYFDKRCNNCKNATTQAKKEFFEIFQKHICESLEKLKENNWEDWTDFIPKIREQTSIEWIVHFINEKFYRLESKSILKEKVFELADKWDIQLFQIYSKDFNIFNEQFLSGEDNQRIIENWELIKKNKIEISEKSKLLTETTRKKWKKENLFTLYFKEIFKNTDPYLGQEWSLFFRKADWEREEKRFRNNKFFGSFDILFNKWKVNHNAKLYERKEKVLEKHIEKINKDTLEKLKTISNENIVYIWIDRWEKEHLTYWVFDGNLNFLWKIWNTNYIKKISKKWEQENFEILWNNVNIVLSNTIDSWEGLYWQLKTNIKYFDEDWKEWENLLELKWLKEFHIKKIFKKWVDWKYFTDLENWWKFILNSKEYGFTILDKNWESVYFINKEDWKEIMDYYLLFESERFKRILEINNKLIYSKNMEKLKKGYISIIKDFFKKMFLEYTNQNKKVVFVFENQKSNKDDITKKYLWATILSDIEEQLINEYNYLFYKHDYQKYQTTPNIRKTDIKLKNNNIYKSFWNFLFVNQDNTSIWCPVCKQNFLSFIRKKYILEIKEIPWKILYWHWKWDIFEKSMHHINDSDNKNYHNGKWKSWTINWKTCDYHIWNKDYQEFLFIKSWDDLATYNIAKKAKEYLEKLLESKD